MNRESLLNYLLNFDKSSDNLILIDGPWGSGKTYLINEFISKYNGCRVFYLSLLGKTNVDDINTALYTEIIKDKPINQIVPSAINPLLYLNNNKNDLDFILKIKNDNPSCIIFLDDLERYASSDYDTLISYVQNLIRSKAKVIIVSNLKEMGGGARHNFELCLEKAFDRILKTDLFKQQNLESKYPLIFKYLDNYEIELIKNNYRVFEKVDDVFKRLINNENIIDKSLLNDKKYCKNLLFYIIVLVKSVYRDPICRYESLKEHIDFKIENELKKYDLKEDDYIEIKVILDYCLNFGQNYKINEDYRLIYNLYLEEFYLE